LHRRQETISTPVQGFDKSGIVGLVAKDLAEFLYRAVQPQIEIYKGVSRPQSLLDLLASNNLAGALEQQGKNLERLVRILILMPDLRNSCDAKSTS
jgi:hypothetical protein